MSFAVTLDQSDAPLRVEVGETILAAALAAELPYPHGCRSGNCGACKSRLLAGEVEMSPYSEFALTAAERADGLVLACRAVPWSDCRLRWLGDEDLVVHPVRRMICRVIAIEDATHDIKRLKLAILSGGPFAFSCGQYCSLAFAGQKPRDYSMANTPDEAELEFHIRRVTGGGASAYVATSLALGETVHLEGPFGTSYLRDAHRGPIVAAAGGSGLAPIKSIIETALAKGMAQDIRLYFGVRAERDLYLEWRFHDLEFRHGNFRFVPVLSDPQGATSRRTGFVHTAIAADFTTLDGAKLYVAGPPPMVRAVQESVAARGVQRENIHADPFFTEADKANLEGTAS